MIAAEKFEPSAIKAADLLREDAIDRRVCTPVASLVLLSDQDRVALTPQYNEEDKRLELGLPTTKPLPVIAPGTNRGMARQMATFFIPLIRPLTNNHVARVSGVLAPNPRTPLAVHTLNPTRREVIIPFVVSLYRQPQLPTGSWYPLDVVREQLSKDDGGRMDAFRAILLLVLNHRELYKK